MLLSCFREKMPVCAPHSQTFICSTDCSSEWDEVHLGRGRDSQVGRFSERHKLCQEVRVKLQSISVSSRVWTSNFRGFANNTALYRVVQLNFTPGLIYIICCSRDKLLCLVKYVSKVRGQLCDSRKSYFASVTILQRAGNSTPQIKYAKKYRKLFISGDTDSLW